MAIKKINFFFHEYNQKMMMNPIDTMSLYDKINSRIYILRSANNAANTQMKTEQVSQMENGLHWLFSIFLRKD
ncbi:hypothetical protein FC94_GL000226 [Lactobacillus kefiranofaciens subsp. kefirgranum DSM 10550 = JCM 8572]|nr:hypothetical protein FC94_GL000226 [Lactobacillus kefiranofaciens subsp. kefirgranum DSM 10550 = JCM 8572]